MKRVEDFPRVYLYRPFADMRKQIAGLSVMIQEHMQLSPFDPAVFVFINRRRDLIKAIYWDESGFAMWVKRLDQEKFIWPRKFDDEVIELTPEQMRWLLSGLDVWKMKGHKALNYGKVS